MFDSFKKEYYGIDSLEGGTQVNFPAFKTLFPMIVFDVRKQNEKLKTGVTDIQVKLFFNANVPANTNACGCIISDRFFKMSSDGSSASFDRVQHITEPTHTAGGTLDHVYTRSGEAIIDAGVETVGSLSDHSFITWKLKFIRNLPIATKKTGRCWKNLDRPASRQALARSAICFTRVR